MKRREKVNALKDVGRENYSGTKHKAGNRSSEFLEIHPVRPGLGDTITLSFETV